MLLDSNIIIYALLPEHAALRALRDYRWIAGLELLDPLTERADTD